MSTEPLPTEELVYERDDQALNETLNQEPQTEKPLTVWEDFNLQLRERADEIGSQLPSNLPKDHFINAAIAAVKQTPDILKASPRSLFAAITKAAQDGLKPDGREGVITVYYDTKKRENVASWNPMIFGLRKRARELDGIIVDAQVVHQEDFFEWDQGDDPKIVHRPKGLGNRGPIIGAYAIFRIGDAIVHREVMDVATIETTRKQSKAPDSLMWKTFYSEGCKKVVGRRGFKSVPCSPSLLQLVTRDDDLFDFPDDAQPKLPKPAVSIGEKLANGTRPEATYIEKAPRSPVQAEEASAAVTAQPAPSSPVATTPGENGGLFDQIDSSAPVEPSAFGLQAEIEEALAKCKTKADVLVVKDEFQGVMETITPYAKSKLQLMVAARYEELAK